MISATARAARRERLAQTVFMNGLPATLLVLKARLASRSQPHGPALPEARA